MVTIHCEQSHCPYQYYCNTSNECIHDPVFPLNLYTILIYCIFPFASAICNTSGNSFGEFKVLLLMDLLDYSQSGATVVTYPLTVGTALFNFITLIFRRHPSKPTSVVDYNIVMIIIPSVLYGSTIGALVNKFIPPIIADALIIVILGAFSVKFFLRFYNFRKEGKQEQQKELAKLTREIQISQVKQDKAQFKKNLMDRKIQIEYQDSERSKPPVIDDEKGGNQSLAELEKQLKYEQSYHIPHILATCLIFGVFEALSFLAQGKIIIFTICSQYYPIGISMLTVVFLGFMVFMYLYTKRKMNYYRQIKYNYQYQLDSFKFFIAIVLASFLGGFNGGVFGLGSSTTMIFCLLYLQIDPIVVSATVGFQVVFSGLGSLCQAFATDQITLQVAAFFFGITFVLGGILSFFSLRLVKKLNKNKTNQVLMLIVGCLTGTSVFALIANIIISYHNFGAPYMISSPFQC